MPRPDGSLTTTERGYGARHVAERKRLAPIVAAGGALCVRCGRVIVDGKVRRRDGRLVSNWVPDHNDDRTGYLGPAHLVCNARAGVQKANRRRGRRRPRVFGALVTSRQW